MFQERLNKLLKDNNLFQSDLAEYVGYTTQAISRWCRGETEPDLNSLVKIANFFNVSTDYLTGKNDILTEAERELKEKIILKNTLVNAGYMKNSEDLSKEELKKLIEFIKINKKYIKEFK